METNNTVPQNGSIVNLKGSKKLKEIFKAHRTFDEVSIPEKADLLNGAEGKVDSLEPEPNEDTVFSFRVNDTVFRLPYAAIDPVKFKDNATRTKTLDFKNEGK
ncbi:MAG TPA: hypothetical protein VGC65_00235 [Bacteroidia bacterium]|jgi:hypothetical protein